MTDVIQLAQKLVRFQSFGGQIEPVFDYLHAALSGHGFNVRLLDCTEAGPSPVLYAAAGEGKGGLLFAGHLDVASPGTEADWKNGAFAGEIKNGSLCARGICEMKGAVAALASVAKLPFHHAHDGISYTFAISPATLGKERDIQVSNLVGLLDGYFTPDGGQHLNVNVFDKELLMDAMEHPEKYPQLTIRVSGYAVNFVKLTREQQLDVISRTINHSL